MRRVSRAGPLLAALQERTVDVALVSTELSGLEADALEQLVLSGKPLVLLTADWQDTRGAQSGWPKQVVVLPLSAPAVAVRRALISALALHADSRNPRPALRRAQAERMRTTAPAERPADMVLGAAGLGPPMRRRRSSGLLIGVLDALPGSDGLQVSLNLAEGLASVGPWPTLVVDLDLDAPRLGLSLNLDLTRGLYGVIQQGASRDDAGWAAALRRQVQPLHRDSQRSFALVGLPPDARGAALRRELTPDVLAELAEQLRAHYGYVVVNFGASLDHQRRAMLERSNEVLVVTTNDIVGLRAAISLRDSVLDQVADETRAHWLAAVLSRYRRGPGLFDQTETAVALQLEIAAAIPPDDRAFQRALDAQRPLVGTWRSQRNPAARALLGLAERIHARRMGVHQSWWDRRRAQLAGMLATLRSWPAAARRLRPIRPHPEAPGVAVAAPLVDPVTAAGAGGHVTRRRRGRTTASGRSL